MTSATSLVTLHTHIHDEDWTKESQVFTIGNGLLLKPLEVDGGE